jgi:integrase
MRAKLTNGSVERFTCRPGQRREVLWDTEVKGFGLRVSEKSSTRTYFFQFRLKGSRKERSITIGRHSDPWRVDQARAQAIALKVQFLNGIDPIEKRNREREARTQEDALAKARNTTLRQVMEHYLEHKRTKHGQLRPASKAAIRRHVEVNLSEWIDEPLVTISRDKALKKFVVMSESAPTQANQCFFCLRALCNYAREMHAAEDGTYPVLAVNPITQVFKLRKPNPKNARKERIPLNRVGAVWNYLRLKAAAGYRDHERTACDWVSTILLTGMRLTESASLKRDDVDLMSRTIRLRRDVVKNHNEIFLPISEPLLGILSARLARLTDDSSAARRRCRPRDTTYVFPSFGKKKPYIYDARATLEAVSNIAGCHISPHSLRRTAEDIAQHVKVDRDHRRMLQNHKPKDVHDESYANNPDPELLRPAMDAIADFVVEAARAGTARIAAGERLREINCDDNKQAADFGRTEQKGNGELDHSLQGTAAEYDCKLARP